MDNLTLGVKIAKTMQNHFCNRFQYIQREDIAFKSLFEHPQRLTQRIKHHADMSATRAGQIKGIEQHADKVTASMLRICATDMLCYSQVLFGVFCGSIIVGLDFDSNVTCLAPAPPITLVDCHEELELLQSYCWRSRANHTVELVPQPSFAVIWYLLLRTSQRRAGQKCFGL